jgi:FkbM family methyltransferase
MSRLGLMSHPFARGLFRKAYFIYKGTIEARGADRLRQLAPCGGTVLDIGANIGFFTLKFAKWVGPAGKVIAVEPDEENFHSLRCALRRSGLEARVVAIQAVAAEKPGRLRLERNVLNPSDHKIAVGSAGIEVPAVSIDALIEGGAFPAVSLIKIDVQGAELMVLAGAKRTLAAHWPALYVEIDDRALSHYGSSRESVLAFVENLGYRMHMLAGDEGAVPSLSRERLSAEIAAKGYADVLFLHERSEVSLGGPSLREAS